MDDQAHGADVIRRTSRRSGLTATFVRQVRKPGRYVDGQGLCLVVDPSGASRWVLRIQANGRRRDVGLGGSRTTALAEARDLAHEIRRKVKSGMDPVAARRSDLCIKSDVWDGVWDRLNRG